MANVGRGAKPSFEENTVDSKGTNIDGKLDKF